MKRRWYWGQADSRGELDLAGMDLPGMYEGEGEVEGNDSLRRMRRRWGHGKGPHRVCSRGSYNWESVGARSKGKVLDGAQAVVWSLTRVSEVTGG